MCDKLQAAREIISQTDAKMASLFEIRMKAVRDVAEYKKEAGLPVLNPEREAENLKRNSQLISEPDLLAYYEDFLRSTMRIAREYQYKLNGEKEDA